MKNLMFVLLFLNVFAVVSPTGVDSYEIYLNNKLLFRQSLDKPVQLISLPITEANAGDNLVVNYMQCNAPGKTGSNRSISIKDAEGKIVKKWTFKDAEGSNTSMVIPVKDLLAIMKNSPGALSLHYSAEGLVRSQQLANLQTV
jgi:hypothetical protein